MCRQNNITLFCSFCKNCNFCSEVLALHFQFVIANKIMNNEFMCRQNNITLFCSFCKNCNFCSEVLALHFQFVIANKIMNNEFMCRQNNITLFCSFSKNCRFYSEVLALHFKFVIANKIMNNEFQKFSSKTLHQTKKSISSDSLLIILSIYQSKLELQQKQLLGQKENCTFWYNCQFDNNAFENKASFFM
eukprot:TRINITY_DN2536_c2_g1_i1.p2 TRINITY_DN2536_c2_g1~~TRINITY_DN2536_c2_g1_i1.p2  ORF type:complete len:190 (-),score=-3.30 TRINITY_DN2536_c2_g1_i1:309-878(-)